MVLKHFKIILSDDKRSSYPTELSQSSLQKLNSTVGKKDHELRKLFYQAFCSNFKGETFITKLNNNKNCQ